MFSKLFPLTQIASTRTTSPQPIFLAGEAQDGDDCVRKFDAGGHEVETLQRIAATRQKLLSNSNVSWQFLFLADT